MSQPYTLDALFMPPGAGEKSDTHMTIKARSAMLGGDFSIMEGLMEPRSLLAPHTHEHEDQAVYVIDGELWFEIGGRGGEVFRAPAGSYVIKPRGISHAFWNATDEPVRYIELSGRDGFEGFVDSHAEHGAIGSTLRAKKDWGMAMHTTRIPEMLLRYKLKRVSSVEMPWEGDDC